MESLVVPAPQQDGPEPTPHDATPHDPTVVVDQPASHQPAIDAAADGVRTPATHRDRAVLALIVTWITIGLAIDTRKHRTDDRLDTFFTSAHGVLYAGWIAAAVYLSFLARQRAATGARRRSVVPIGLEGATVGALLFGVGGVGDMIWHTHFGIEREIKILFSPTHLVLMTAMLLICFGPVRSAWLSDRPASVGHLWPPVLAMGAASSVLLVFFQYVSAFDRPIFTTVVPTVFGFDQVLRIVSVSGVVIVTTLLYAPLLLLARRWALPPGAATLAFSLVALTNFIYTDFQAARLSLAIVIGGVVTDLVAVIVRRVAPPRVAYRVIAGLAPVLFWCSYLVVTRHGGTITWSTEQWTGTILWSGLIGLGLTVLLLPLRQAPRSWLDDDDWAGPAAT